MTDADELPSEEPDGDSELMPDFSDDIHEMVKQCYGWREGNVLTGYVVVAAVTSIKNKSSIVKLIQHPYSPLYADRGMMEEALDYMRNSNTYLIPCEGDDE